MRSAANKPQLAYRSYLDLHAGSGAVTCLSVRLSVRPWVWWVTDPRKL